MKVWVIRADDTGRAVADFRQLPNRRDVVLLDLPERNLAGRFRVIRREFLDTESYPCSRDKLIVEAALPSQNLK